MKAGKGRRRHWRRLVDVGPVVAEAMAVNAVLRAFSGYILFLLAFLLRSVDLGTVFDHPVSHNFALGALALGLSAGSLASMVLGSFFRSRAPQLIMFTVLIIAPVVTAVCAWGFGLWAAVGGRVHRDLLRQPGQARPRTRSSAARSATRSGPRRSPSPRRSTRSPTWPAGWPGCWCPCSTTGRRAWRSRPEASSSRWSCWSSGAGSGSALSRAAPSRLRPPPEPAANRLGRDVLGDGRQQL